jgi:hypothetical protein
VAASTETLLLDRLEAVLRWRRDNHANEAAERNATVYFMDTARESHWSWEKIGRSIGITGTAARRFYERNRRRVRSV